MTDCWLTADWLLTDCWLTADWLLTDCWLTADWLLTDCLKIWARKMKIDCSRQTWTGWTDERTNGRTLWLLELLSEPKRSNIIVCFSRVHQKIYCIHILSTLAKTPYLFCAQVLSHQLNMNTGNHVTIDTNPTGFLFPIIGKGSRI